MSNGNPFYIAPAKWDFGSLGKGIGNVIQQAQEKRKKEERVAEIDTAFKSGDPEQVMQIMTKYPDEAKAIESRIGFANETTKKTLYDAYEGLDMAIEDAKSIDEEGNVTYDPDVLEEAGSFFEGKIDEVRSYGGTPTQMGYDFDRLMSNPGDVQESIQMGKAMLQPDLYASLRGEKLPKSVQEWRFFSKLTEEQKVEYLGMKRAGYAITDVAGVPTLVNKNNPSAPAIPLSTLNEEAAAAAQVASETASEKLKATGRTEAEIRLPMVERESAQMVDLLDQMIEHPARESATGRSGVFQEMLPEAMTAGTPFADFQTLKKQVQGKTFLQAFETLKGGGQITEVEGRKATEAMARLQTEQSDAGFLQALQDFRREVLVLKDVIYVKSGAKMAHDTETGELFWQLPDGSLKPRYQ